MSAVWQALGDVRCALGESPFWHPHEQMLYWLDITARQVLRANIYMGSVERWDMPSEPGCMAPVEGGGLVLALRHGVFRSRAWGGALEPLAVLPYDPVTVRANDGKCDAQGRFWVGTVDETRAQQAAALYCIDARGSTAQVTCMADGALTANGLAWSPDGATLYWADTPRHTVSAWDCDGQRPRLQRRRVFLEFSPKPAAWVPGASGYGGRPDGATVDSMGHYWSAMYEGARLCRFAPDGALLETLPMPVQCPTMPCFGGEDLRTLYVTSARQGRGEAELAAQPLAGALLYRRLDTPGLPVQFFRAPNF